MEEDRRSAPATHWRLCPHPLARVPLDKCRDKDVAVSMPPRTAREVFLRTQDIGGPAPRGMLLPVAAEKGRREGN